jgi:hypothetical protein
VTLLRRLDLDAHAHADEAPAPGVEGNRRLTAALGAVLLLLLAVEGGTIPFLGQVEVVHVVVGLVLIPIVLLKLGTTFYRFARYYAADRDYRRSGPPHPVMRMAGPFVVVTTVALFASGVTLAIVGRHSQIVYGIHKASFIAWFAAMTVHVLGHVWSTPSVAVRDWSAAQRMPGSRVRQLTVVGVTLAGLGAAAIVYPLLPAWGHG